jgi:scyllo-inositol 2-dehydrogenase (NADP+)
MIKVGVIGCGYSAKTFHIPLITVSDSFELTAISSSQGQALKSQFPQVSVFDRAEDLIANADVNLVVITAPNNNHYPIAKKCLENGLNVIVEKPMVTNSAEAQELVNIARQGSLLLSVFHNRRWDGDFLTVKRLIANQRLGDLGLLFARGGESSRARDRGYGLIWVLTWLIRRSTFSVYLKPLQQDAYP